MGLVLTKMLEFRVKNPNFDKNEYRPRNFGALDFFVQQSNQANSLLTSETKEKALASIGRDLKVPVIDRDNEVQISNVRSCTIPDAENTSRLINFTFVTYSGGFHMYPNRHMNNEISYQEDFNRKMIKLIQAFGNALDQDALTALDTFKTKVLADKLIYDFQGNTVKAAYDYREDILGDIEPLMYSNDFNGAVHVVGNTGLMSFVNKLAEHGLYNDVNKAYEYAGKQFHFTNNLVNEEGDFASFFAVEDGQVDLLQRLDRTSIAHSETVTDAWEPVVLPGLNILAGSHYKKPYTTNVASALGAEDTSVADMVCDVAEEFGFAFDICFVTAYNSNPAATANPCIKFEIERTDNAAGKPVRIVNTVATKAAE